METERSQEFDPREQLRAYAEASQAAEIEAYQPAPLWFWSVVSLLAPASVAFQRTDGALELVLVPLFLVPALAALVFDFRRTRAAKAKVKAPTSGGRTSLWRVPSLFCFIMGLNMTTLLQWDSGLAVGLFTYAFSAIGATFFWRKADQQIIERFTAPIPL